MRARSDNVKFLDLVLVAFVVAVFVFASPFYLLWMAPDTPWYVPYLIWLCVIVMTGVVQRWRDRHEL
jgi:O-antigen/teichoic acid export membrane protein